MKITDLKINSSTEMIGIYKLKDFSWKIESDKNAVKQVSYRISVRDAEKLIWDSGRVLSDASVNVKYGGDELSPQKRYTLKVELEDNSGDTASAETEFETGLMSDDKKGWDGAKWIGAPVKTINTGAVSAYKFAVNYRCIKGAAGIAVNARNFDKYFLFTVDEKKLKVCECSDNAWSGSRAEGVRPYTKVRGEYEIPDGLSKEENRFELSVNEGNASVWINGSLIADSDEIFELEKDHHPYKRRLFMFGFKQNDSEVIYDNIYLEAIKPKKEMLIDEHSISVTSALSALGDVENGKLRVKDRFSLITPQSAPALRKNIEIKKDIRSARLYSSARGAYDIYINGKKFNKDFYNPGFTDYRLRIMYQTYDITEALEVGENVFGVLLGNGYWSGFLGYSGYPMIYGEAPSFIGKIVIEYTDGERTEYVTDSDWQCNVLTPVLYNDYLNGEIYDARIDFGWTDMQSEKWMPSAEADAPARIPTPTNGTEVDAEFSLSPQYGPVQSVYKELEGKYVCEALEGHSVYDLGQNMVGTVRIRLRGKRGDAIKIRYGEMCYRSGEVYLRNLRTALNTDVYILNGDEDGEVFCPSFTFHGFRYVEISGCGGELNCEIEEVTGFVITNNTCDTGYFECSNPDVNKLFSNITWGQRGNSLLVYTDCPQRNERMGWTGDAQVFVKTAAYNADIKLFTEKWLLDLRDAQLMYNKNGAVPDTAPLGGDNRPDACAGWADAAVIVPWELYRAYGDISILEDNLEMMEKWVAYQNRSERRNNGMRTVDGMEMPEESDLADIPYIQTQQSRGDHLTFDESTPFILTATAYAAYVADIMIKVCETLGKDSSKYRELFENIKRAFNSAWVCPDGTLSYWGEMSKEKINRTRYGENEENKPSQTAYVMALKFNLIDGEERRKNAAAALRAAIERENNCLTTGFLGISHLNPTLTETGNNDIAYKLLLQDKNPSWLYSVKNGATTIWERWNSYIAEKDKFGDVSMNSFNHYSYGAVGEWMFETVLGISPKEPGYSKILISPKPDKALDYAKGYFISPYGRIESGWERCGDKIKLRTVIPPNTEAEIVFGGKTYTVMSGEHFFEAEES